MSPTTFPELLETSGPPDDQLVSIDPERVVKNVLVSGKPDVVDLVTGGDLHL